MRLPVVRRAVVERAYMSAPDGIQPPAVHHLAIVARDLDLAEAFYCGVLGLPVMKRWDDEESPRSVWLALGGGAFLAVERAAAGGPKRVDAAPGWHCVALTISVGARAAWRARLVEARVAIERESPFSIYMRDPEGNLVALSHWPDAVG